MNPLFLILSFLDVAGAFTLLLNTNILIITQFFAGFATLKGLWSLMASLSSKYYFDWMGWTDLAAGTCLLLLSRGIILEFFSIIAAIYLIKGVYSTVLSL